MEIISLYGVVWEGLSEMITFERDQNEGRAEADIWNQIEGRACAKVLRQDCVIFKVQQEGWYISCRMSKWESCRRWGQKGTKDLNSEMESRWRA